MKNGQEVARTDKDFNDELANYHRAQKDIEERDAILQRADSEVYISGAFYSAKQLSSVERPFAPPADTWEWHQRKDLGRTTPNEKPVEELLKKTAEEEMLDKRYLEEAPGEPKKPSYEADLEKLIGMAGPKAEVQRLANSAAMSIRRKQAGLPPNENSFHMSFTGNPGTGKTTFARIVAKVLHHHGILPFLALLLLLRSSLVGGFIGHSEKAVKEKLEEALGRVLFIDEFYALAVDGSGSDYGKRVIDVLVKFMEDHRDNISVIVAGYTEPMKTAIASNPGLKSRFTRTIHFPDYSAEELLEIFDNMLTRKQYTLSDDAYAVVGKTVKAHYANRGEDFGNARDMRTLFERVTDVQANRVMNDNSPITVITADDVREAAALVGMK